MTGQALFDSAIFSGNKLEIEKYVYIDGDVATNGSKIEKEKGVTITGSEETSVGKTLDSITFSCSSCNADKKIKNDETWSSDTYEYKKLEIEKKTTITISGDVILYVKEDFKVEKEVTFRLLDGASLTVYVDKKVELEKKFAIEFPQGPDRPEDFVIFGTSNADTIKIGKESTFIGAIYAPDAKIEVEKKSDITGSLVGDEVKIGKEGNITWDPDVGSVSTPVGGNGSSVVLSGPVQYFSP